MLSGFFKFPNNLCNEIDRLIRNYRWAEKNNKRKNTGVVGIKFVKEKNGGETRVQKNEHIQ